MPYYKVLHYQQITISDNIIQANDSASVLSKKPQRAQALPD